MGQTTGPSTLNVRSNKRELPRFALRCLSLALLVVYIGWNLFELAHLAIPSSLFWAITGLPCPTTGGTRAMLALLDGRVHDSLHWNPMAVPITVLGCLTIVQLWRVYLRDRQLKLSARWLRCWLWMLGIAWVLQLALFRSQP